MKNLAPIVLIVYNRLWHTKKTIDALLKNKLAEKSDLIIFSDAPKNSNALKQVQEVRDYIKNVTGFKSIRIVKRDENWGLAKSIISGVSEVVNQYGKVIVLEDDNESSPGFLLFMNQALDFYQDEKKVWHISGWNYPVCDESLGDAFLWRVMNCSGGWATWADRWQYFEKNPQALVEQWSIDQKNRFDLDGSGVFWRQIKSNLRGKTNTWAVFWYATIFKNNGLCLNPTISYVKNIGYDGTGIHSSSHDSYSVAQLNTKTTTVFPDQLVESPEAVSIIKFFLKSQKPSLIVRVINKISRTMIGKNYL